MAAAAETAASGAGGGSSAAASSEADASVTRTAALSLSDFDLGETLGTGSFSRVFVARNNVTGKPFAIKRVKKAECVRLQQSEHIQNERSILLEVDHPFVVRLVGTFQDARYAYLVLDFVQGGELYAHLRKAGRFPTETAAFYLAQLVEALEYLHRRSIVYRDVKPENLLLDTTGYLRLVDFGFAKRVPFKTYTLCGTPEYAAPEVVLNRGHGRGVDWWGAGVLLYEMLVGQPPFVGDSVQAVYGQIIEGRVLFPAHVERGARSLVRHLLQSEPAKRFGCLRRGASDVREHAFLAGTDWKSLVERRSPAPIVPAVDDDGDLTHFDPYPDTDDEEPPLPAYEDADPFVAF